MEYHYVVQTKTKNVYIEQKYSENHEALGLFPLNKETINKVTSKIFKIKPTRTKINQAK